MGVTLTSFRDVPFDGEDFFVVVFFNSINRPRCFVGVDDVDFNLVSFGVGGSTGAGGGGGCGAGGGGDVSCSIMTASLERNRNGDRFLNVFNIPFDGLSAFLVVRSFVSKSISSSRK
jgi:hypothetical protein